MILACVRTGAKYPFGYVVKLRNMIERHTGGRLDVRLVCLTDQPERCRGVDFIDISDEKLPGWWAKMALFKFNWRSGHRVVFLDLDTVIVGSLIPLLHVDLHPFRFGICDNFARLAGSTNWPCKYNSSVMVLDAQMDDVLWRRFNAQRGLMEANARYGDQMVIEHLIYPDAVLLQHRLPAGYFLNYRNLTEEPPQWPTAIVNFGGKSRPHNSPLQWVKQSWT